MHIEISDTEILTVGCEKLFIIFNRYNKSNPIITVRTKSGKIWDSGDFEIQKARESTGE